MKFLDIGKEVILEESANLEKLAKSLGNNFVEVCERILKTRGHIIITGMGKSGHIAQKIAATFSSTGTPAFFLHPAEGSHGDLGVITEHNTVIAISNSGESKELFDILEYCKRNGVFLIGITSKESSTLGKYSDITIKLPLEKEACKLNLAPTNSTTMTLALGDAIAVAVYENKNFTSSDFSIFHPGGKLGKQLVTVESVMRNLDHIALVNENSNFEEILITISSKIGGCATVIHDVPGNPILLGVITDGDIRRFITTNKLKSNIFEITAKDIMSNQPLTTNINVLAADAIHIMNKNRITAMPVVDKNNVLKGLLHIHDLVNLGF